MWVSAFSTKPTRRTPSQPPPTPPAGHSPCQVPSWIERYRGLLIEETLGWELTSEKKYSCGLCVQFQVWLQCDKAGYTERICMEVSTAQCKRPEGHWKWTESPNSQAHVNTSWRSLVVLKFSLTWMGYVLLNGAPTTGYSTEEKKKMS